MSSFFQKARERAQEAAAQFSQQHQGGAEGGAGENGSPRNSSIGTLPHFLRHGMASVDPRHEYNRSFHLLNGKIKALRIDLDAVARETKAVANTTCRWGQDHLPQNREDGVGDEALADMTDRLAYIFSLISDLQTDYAKGVESSRANFKKIQKAEQELAPKRAARVKIHKELITLIPERAKGNSSKIAPLEAQLETLEKDDKPLEEELGRVKREVLKSSYDAHFDSMIDLGEKMALVARYGKLMNAQLPVYPQPFPSPRHSLKKGVNDESWPGEAKLDAIRAAVEPALKACTPDHSLPPMPESGPSVSLTKRDTIRYSETHKQDLEKAIRDEDAAVTTADESQEVAPMHVRTGSASSPSALPMGGSLPPNLNLGPSPLPASRSNLGAEPPALPPRDVSSVDEAHLSPPATGNPTSAMIADNGPTLAETGSPIMSSAGGPGPLTGTLSPRIRSPSASVSAPKPFEQSFASSKDEKARLEQQEVQSQTVAARIRRDGTIVRRGDKDWADAESGDLPPYRE